MNGNRNKVYPKIIIVSPFTIKIPTLDKVSSQNFYLTIQAFNTQEALISLAGRLPVIMIVDIFMDERPNNIDESLALIKKVRNEVASVVIIGTSSIPVKFCQQEKIIISGANTYLATEIIKQNFQEIISHYEAIANCNKTYLQHNPDKISLIRKAVLYLNKTYLKIYFQKNPNKRNVRIYPWGTELFNKKLNNHKINLPHFEFGCEEVI